jgi:PAS domain S-box-containing protein
MGTAREPPTVLIVEDHPLTAQMVAALLGRAGIGVRTAASVDAALGVVAGEPLSAVVLDYRLPDGKPWAVLEAARRREPRVPVILITAQGDERIAAEAIRRGADHYVLKDEDFVRRLPEAVRRVLDESRGRAELVDSERRHRLLVETLSEAVVAADETGRITAFSAGAERLLGRRAAEVRGRPVTELLPADGLRRARALFDEFLAADPDAVAGRFAELEVLAADGRRIPVSASLSAQPVGPGRMYVSVVRDNSARRTAESDLAAARAQLAQTDKMRALGQMAAGIAHDFNNALSAIAGFADGLSRGVAHGVIDAAALAGLRTAVEDAAAMVRRLQILGRPEAEPPVRGAVDLDALVAAMPDLTRHRWDHPARPPGAAIAVRVSPGGAGTVAADPAEIREILANLILNAADALPAGGTITLSTGRRGDEAFVSVADDGPGMSAEVRHRCFEPFFTTKGVEGTGLGLAVSWSLAERQGGRLEVVSRPGDGSVFTLRLPAGPPAPQPTGDVPAPGRADHADQADRAGALRILAIDDEPLVREALTGLLTFLGHTVRTAADGDEGLHRLDDEAFDLVITDLGLPGRDGRGVAAAVKRMRPGTPVVLLTGWADTGGSAGPDVDLVLGKPVAADALQSALRRLTAGR